MEVERFGDTSLPSVTEKKTRLSDLSMDRSFLSLSLSLSFFLFFGIRDTARIDPREFAIKPRRKATIPRFEHARDGKTVLWSLKMELVFFYPTRVL